MSKGKTPDKAEDAPSKVNETTTETDAAKATETPEVEAVEPADLAERAPVTQHEEAVAESSGSSFASTVLMLLLLILVVIGLTLWAGPKLAPHVPAPVAQYLNPIPNSTADSIAALEARLKEAEDQIRANAASAAQGLEDTVTAIEGRVAALEGGAGAADAMAKASSVETALAEATDIAEGAATAATANGQTLEGMKTQVAGLEGELRALTAALTAGQEGEPVAAELQAAMQAMQSRVDTLAASVSAAQAALPALLPRGEAEGFASQAALAELSGALDAQISVVQADLGAQIAAVAEQAEAAKLTGFDALEQAETAVEAAALRGAESTLASRVAGGLPYAGALAEVVALGGAAAPEALSSLAETGLVSLSDLSGRLPAAARAAIDADRRAELGDGTGAQIAAWFDSQVQTRPTVATEGNDTASILSRIQSAVGAGDLPVALGEADQLSDPAKTAMADWLGDLANRVAAEKALAAYLTTAAGAE